MVQTDKAFTCTGTTGLPLSDDDSWDGPAAEASLFAWAGWPDDPDADKAARGFLVHDTVEPDLKASFKLPYCRVIDGKLTASTAGLRAAAARLPQTADLSPEVSQHARAVIDSYLNRGDNARKPKMAEHVFEKQFDSELTSPAAIPEAIQREINRHAGEEVPPDEIMVRYACLANDRYDRSHERFPPEVLDRFAETIGGKSVLPGHDRGEIPIGVWLKGEVIRDDAGTHNLRVPFYMDRRSPEGRKVRLGIAKQTSISFKAGGRTCDLCGDDYDGQNGCPNGHRKGQNYDGRVCTVTYSGDLEKYEALEGSLVWLGCQYGAEVSAAKAMDPYGGHELMVARPALTTGAITAGGMNTAGSVVTVEPAGVHPPVYLTSTTNTSRIQLVPSAPPSPAIVTKSATAEEKVMPEEIDELKAKVAEQEEMISAKALEIKSLSELAEDGKAYREHLRTEIARKMAAATCETAEAAETEAQAILTSLATVNLETLKAWDQRAQRLFDQKFPPSVQAKVMGDGAAAAPDRSAEGQMANPSPVFDPRASMRRAG